MHGNLRCIGKRSMGGSESAPHPAFGHLLPASQGEGESRVLLLCLLLHFSGEGGTPRGFLLLVSGRREPKDGSGPLFACEDKVAEGR